MVTKVSSAVIVPLIPLVYFAGNSSGLFRWPPFDGRDYSGWATQWWERNSGNWEVRTQSAIGGSNPSAHCSVPVARWRDDDRSTGGARARWSSWLRLRPELVRHIIGVRVGVGWSITRHQVSLP